MKKVLILVISSDFFPYNQMIETSKSTWDSIDVEGTETIFYCSQKDNPNWKNSEKVMYFDTGNTLNDMGDKNIEMFDWALKNKDFDYVARLNASCYCNKRELIKYVQTLPTENVFAGLTVTATPCWKWGGGMFTMSRDVIQKLVDERANWRRDIMEDQSLSYIINKLGIPYMDGRSCSIDKMDGNTWRCMVYGHGESFEFTDFEDIKKAEGQFYFRIKQDYDRTQDEVIMKELFKVLQ